MHTTSKRLDDFACNVRVGRTEHKQGTYGFRPIPGGHTHIPSRCSHTTARQHCALNLRQPNPYGRKLCPASPRRSMIIPIWRSRSTSGRLCALSLRRLGPRKSKLCDTSWSVHVRNRRSRNTSGRMCDLSLGRPRPIKSKLRNQANQSQRTTCATWLDARNCVGGALRPESAPTAKRHTTLLAHASRTSARMPNLRHPEDSQRASGDIPSAADALFKSRESSNTAPRRSMHMQHWSCTYRGQTHGAARPQFSSWPSTACSMDYINDLAPSATQPPLAIKSAPARPQGVSQPAATCPMDYSKNLAPGATQPSLR